MTSNWKSVQEAARDFRKLLDKRFTQLVVSDFRLQLRTSLQENENFKEEMSKCGALEHWEDENHLEWLITKETIQRSIQAMESHCGPIKDPDFSDDKPKPEPEMKPRIARVKRQVAREASSASALLTESGYDPKPVQPPRALPRKQIPESSSEEDPSDTPTKEIAGKPLEIISPRKYIQIKDLIAQPILDSKELHPVHAIIPFLVQKIKMWGCNILTAEKINQLFKKGTVIEEPTSKISFDDLISKLTISQNDENTTVSENLVPLCKLDIYSVLTAVTEITVLAEMFRILSKFPQTLPLVLPNLDKEGNATHILMTPALQRCLIRWETPVGLVENYLFRSPYKLVTALRLGTNTTGKSTIINQLFQCSNMFQCRGQPGGNRGIPFSVAGSVEFVWLIEETCQASTWLSIETAQKQSEDKSEIALLANLHGDAMEYYDVLKSIAPITSKFLVFVMPDAVTDLRSRGKKLVEACGEEKISYLFVDPPGSSSVQNISIKTTELLNDATLQKLNKHIKDALETTKPVSLQPSREKSVKIITPLETPESEELLRLISDMKSKEIDLRNVLCLQQHFNSPEEQWKLWEANENSQQLMILFSKVMKLPLQARRLALAHIEKELSILIGVKVTKYTKKLAELVEAKNNYKLNRNSDTSLLAVNQQIYQIHVELGKSLGLEDLLRELGFLYEMMTSKSIDLPIYTDLPDYYAELMIEGMTLEILDGDLGTISGNWLEAVCHSVCKKMPKLKVFVISILGLQSSGKSTLLNALFGCKFAVSVGKCTRGLFMRLMLVEKQFRKILKIDAILVVDTEGLGAPENMTDKDAEVKDRRMATFAMTISNLTLINVFGEAKSEIAHIMQIVILTMARMDKADLAPDILLVQHVAEGGQEYKIQQGVNEFCLALDEAVQVAKVKVLDLGIKGLENLKNIRDRIENQELLIQMRPFKNGASPQSPPTEEYHNDIIKLRHQIFNQIQNKFENRISFCTWHKVLKSYWDAIRREDFALRFVSIRQVQEYIEVNRRMAFVKNHLDASFRYHEDFLREYINDKLSAFNSSEDRSAIKMFEDEIHKEIRDSIESLPNNCSSPLNITNKKAACKFCRVAETSRTELIDFVKHTSSVGVNETEETLEKYIIRLRNSSITQTLRIFESVKIQVGIASDVDKILNEIMTNKDDNELSNGQPQSANAVWFELQCRVQKEHPIRNIRQQVFEDILDYYPQAPNRNIWKMSLEHVPQSANDPKPTLTMLKTKKKKTKANSKCFHTTALVHNWLCQNMRETAMEVIYQRTQQKQPYHSIMIEHHKTKVEELLKAMENEFNFRIKGDLQWDAILYSVQVFAELVIDFQNKWNEEHEPYLILLREKQEYLKKINIYLLAAQSPSGVQQKIVSSLARKLLDSAVLVTLSSWDAYKNFDGWFADPENTRLCYFVALADLVKTGKGDLVLAHFRNPSQVITEWYFQEIEDCILDSHVPRLKNIFFSECSAMGKEILKTQSSQELNKFIEWYLSKTSEVISESEVITHAMFENIKVALEKEIENGFDEYCEKIMLENIPLDYDLMSEKLGCTATCPRCCAVCWGHKGHELENLVSLKHHFTCHQPMGLAGVVDSTGTLVLTNCSDLDESGGFLMTSLNNQSEEEQRKPEEASWVTGGHPVDAYIRLMQWFFFRLNNSLAEQYEALPVPEKVMKDLGFHTLDTQIDQILNIVRHRSEM